MNPSLKEVLTKGAVKPVFTDFFQAQVLKSSVNMGLNMGINGDSASEALTTAARDVALNSAAAWASYNIGDMGSQGKWTPDQQDLAHTGIGALFGAATHLDKPLEAAITGGLNAFAAARASRIMFGSREELKTQAEEELNQQGRPVTEETVGDMMNDLLHQKTALITLLSASATAAITKDPSMVSTSIAVTTNVVENNCIPSMTKSLMAGEAMNYGEEEPREFWQDEFDDPRDLYYEIFEEQAERSQRITARTLIDPETYHAVQAAHECTIEDFVQDRLSYVEHKTGKSLSFQARQRLVQQYSKSFYTLRQLEADKDFFAPGYGRLSKLSGKSFEELKATRMREMDPNWTFSAAQRSKAERVIRNEFEHYRGQIFNLTISAVLPFVSGKMPLPRATANKTTKTPSKTIEGLDLAGGGKNTISLQGQTKSRTVLTADKIHPSSSIIPLEKPGRVVFDGVEFRAVRDLSHMSERDLRKMMDKGRNPYDVNRVRLDGHHYQQQYHRDLGAFIVEIPESLHNGANKIQHPFGNKKGFGLPKEQRKNWDKTRERFNKERAKQELANRGLLDENK